MNSKVKSVSQIRILIRESEAEIKRIKPSIKSMGSPEARALERLKGKLQAYNEVLIEESKDESVITNSVDEINHIDPILTRPTNKTDDV